MAAFGKEDKGILVDLGHPVLNRSVDAFLKVAGVGALHAASQIAASESVDFVATSMNSERKISKAPLQLEDAAIRVGKQALQWGLSAGVYQSTTLGLMEARGGVHDWKNAMVGGALAGVAVSLTEPSPRPETVLSGALTGGALAVAADFIERL